MKFGKKIVVGIVTFLMVIVNMQTALAVYGSIDLLPVMKKSVKDGKDIPVDIFTKGGEHLGMAHFDIDDGVWYFTFPDRKSHYVAKWKGGNAGLVSPFLSNTETVVLGGAAVLATIAGALALTNTGSSAKPAGEYPVPSCQELNGGYYVEGPKVWDSCYTPVDYFSDKATVQCQGNSLTILSETSMIGFYNNTGSMIVEGYQEITEPVVGIPVPGDTETEDTTTPGEESPPGVTPTTTDSTLPTLRVFREKFTGKAFVMSGGSIVLEGKIAFGFSEQIGTDGICWVNYDVKFTKH